VRTVRRLIQTERPDIVHTTICEANLIGRIAAARTGIPILTSLVSTPYVPARLRDFNLKRWKMRLVQGADGWTARHLTDHFHAITESVKQAAVRDLKINPERITVVPRGRDPDRLGMPSKERRDHVRQILQLDADDVVLINVGRQEYPKGQQFLLRAFERIAARRQKVVLLVAGRKGFSTPELERQMATSEVLRNRVRFLGHRDDVPDLLAAADLFVFPSLYEGLGGAVIEAMALGLPIVASDISALREITDVGGNSLLVPPGDFAALARGIDELLDNSTRRNAFGLRSRQIYAERFMLEPVVVIVTWRTAEGENCPTYYVSAAARRRGVRRRTEHAACRARS
jgi:glycosyltransferase involved in cell wall biosynthesis